MATFLGHSLAALTIIAPLQKTPLGRALPLPWWLGLALLLSLLPDLDILLLRWLPYHHPLSHRGLSHSLFFALVFTLVITVCCRLAGLLQGNIFTLFLVWLALAAAMASHGLLDALTNGGLGVAFFSPLTPRRFFFPVRPLPVAWLSPAGLFTPYMLRLFALETTLFGPLCLAAWLASSPQPLSPSRSLAAAALFLAGTAAWLIRCLSI